MNMIADQKNSNMLLMNFMNFNELKCQNKLFFI